MSDSSLYFNRSERYSTRAAGAYLGLFLFAVESLNVCRILNP
ncbi:heat shock 70 family protein [Pontibacter ruber]|uniref:Heat shock 70 family protein n=1 Tax=Pontibacter ruber TaxID=1343895 RepID=A0ABW5CYM7_9BACT|nr:heat shock 70 family protein [Pontibacter ruber]